MLDLDCVLIHWPGTKGVDPKSPMNYENRTGTYRALLELQKQGIVKYVGVSNYTINHLMQIKEILCEFPVVNQVEFHPLWKQVELLEYCKVNGIKVQAYSSLGEGAFFGEFVLESCSKIAKRLDKSMAQVLLGWATSQGVCIVPKASSKERLFENYNYSREMSQKDVEEIQSEEALHGTRKFCWDPSIIF